MTLPVIVATNYKGGVGKTTTSRVLAQSLAEVESFTQGKSILVIDLDPQGSTSGRWNLLDGQAIPIPHPELGESSSICDLWLEVLTDAETGFEPSPYPTTNPLIDCIPVNEPLMLKANKQSHDVVHAMGSIMVEWIRSPKLAEKYCCVIIDTQPSKASMIDIALMASTHCYVPFIPEPQSVEGIFSILTYIQNRQSYRIDGTPLKFIGALPNMYNPNLRLHRDNVFALRKDPTFASHIMPVELRRRTAYAATDDSRSNPEAVTQLNGPIKREAQLFAEHIIEKIQEV